MGNGQLDVLSFLDAGDFVVRAKNRELLNAAFHCLHAEQPMTLRQLYYRLVSSAAIPNKQSAYQRLGNLMTRAREHGLIPRTWIVDHVRTTLKPSSWSGLADFGDTVREAYRKDFWEGLPHYVCIFVEKDAIAGTIQPITHEHDVALHVCRGYSSVSFAGEIADVWSEIEKPIFAYYLGDFDPSGFDLERDLREKLERYSSKCDWDSGDYYSDGYVAEQVFHWRRLGVIEDDFDAHDLIPLPVKHSDKRAAGFIEEYGHQCAEVDALPPSELRDRVRDAIWEHIDADRWDKLQQIEAAEQRSLGKFLDKWAKRK